MPRSPALLAVIISLASVTTALPRSAFAADPPAAKATGTQGAKLTPVAAHIEPAAMALLDKVQVTMTGLASYEAECSTTTTRPVDKDSALAAREYTTATVVLEKPNRMRYVSWQMAADAKGNWSRKGKSPWCTSVCDGKTAWSQYGNLYSATPVGDLARISTGPEPWTGFLTSHSLTYRPAWFRDRGILLEVRLVGHAVVDGTPCQMVFVHRQEGTSSKHAEEDRVTWYIGPDSLVRRRTEQVAWAGIGGSTEDAVIRHIRTNQPVADGEKVFSYTPPPGAMTSEEFMAAREAKLPKRLAAGAIAPEFAAAGIDGKSIKLSDYRGKVVVVDFWASWCGPCKASMPHMQDLAKRLKAEGFPVVFLAVDNNEKFAPFASWVKANPAYNALDFVFVDQKVDDVIGKLYRVSGIPTQYVIDSSGAIRSSLVGYSDSGSELEKAVRAAALPAVSAPPALGTPLVR